MYIPTYSRCIYYTCLIYFGPVGDPADDWSQEHRTVWNSKTILYIICIRYCKCNPAIIAPAVHKKKAENEFSLIWFRVVSCRIYYYLTYYSDWKHSPRFNILFSHTHAQKYPNFMCGYCVCIWFARS